MATLIPNFDLAEKIGSKVEIDADTVGELISKGVAQYGQPFKESTKVVAILVNGRSVSKLKGNKTRLTSSDSVWFVLPSSGG